MQIRRATMDDMYEMQHSNLRCLPENYNLRYYYYHLLSWPQLLYVQKDYNNNTVGYVLAKLDDEEKKDKRHGHITSLAVLRTHRKLGIASRVMRASMKEMDSEYNAHFCSLHVRKTNDAALHLYQDTLHFRCAGVEEGYYVDQEDAYHMKRFFGTPNPGSYVDSDKHMIRKPVPAAFERSLDGSDKLFAVAAQEMTAAEKPAVVHKDPNAGVAPPNEKKNKGGKAQAAIPQDVDALLQELELQDKGKKGGKNAKNKGKKNVGPLVLLVHRASSSSSHEERGLWRSPLHFGKLLTETCST
eukprot:gene4325-3139_t